MNWYKTAKKIYTKEEMISLGASGYLDYAILQKIPVEKIEGREPTPSASEGDPYEKGRKILVPVEVSYNRLVGTYILWSGNHRVHQAEVNGDDTITAFVGCDRKGILQSN